MSEEQTRSLLGHRPGPKYGGISSDAEIIGTSPEILRRASLNALAVAKDIKEARETGPHETADVGVKGADVESQEVHGDGSYHAGGIDIAFVLGQIPAVLVATILTFMAAIPFGAAYFPTELPLAGKEVLGMRMLLFSTVVAQIVITYKSKFDNALGLQMIENIPFYVELARIVMDEQGTGSEAISTLFFIFGCSSIIVGLFFYMLGKLKLGRVVYFFPSHVLVGCIGGIGAFIFVTAIEVTTNSTFSFSQKGFEECIVANFHLLAPVIAFELVLRVLIHMTGGRYALLNPIYYCMTMPAFYAGLWLFGVSTEKAAQLGYFFPALDTGGKGMVSMDLFDIFSFVNFGDVSFRAVAKSLPTLISLAVFSLIHVPINIPAFAVTTNTEPDMDNELIAHGWSNCIAGLGFGLQNYLTYSNSVVYAKSSGKGRSSSIAVAVLVTLVYIWGPIIAAFVPRCIAGTLLLHVGIDLFIEGVVESYHDYDRLEYGGCWLITISMVALGMDAGLVAGAIAALATFAAQSIINQYPVKGSMTALSLRSSAWNRSLRAEEILEGDNGRQRIFIIQFVGHIFFGNSTTLTDDVKRRLREKSAAGNEPAVVILDFSQVVGIDSTAAHAIAKLKDYLLKNFKLDVVAFVTGEEGFKCHFNLSTKVDSEIANIRFSNAPRSLSLQTSEIDDTRRMSVTARALEMNHQIAEIPNSRVFDSLDGALIFAEDVIIARISPQVLKDDSGENFPPVRRSESGDPDHAKSIMKELCPDAKPEEIDALFSSFEHETLNEGEILWTQGDPSTSMKVIASGAVLSFVEEAVASNELTYAGATIGEIGLVSGMSRLTSVKVAEDGTQLYSLGRDEYHQLVETKPQLARYIDLLVIRYLSHRIQYVSTGERLDKRSLPI